VNAAQRGARSQSSEIEAKVEGGGLMQRGSGGSSLFFWPFLVRVVGLAALLVAFCAAWTAPAGAQRIQLAGSSSYQINGSSVTLRAERILNNSYSSKTGTIHLQLWATTGSSPFGSGTALADANLAAVPGLGDGRIFPRSSFVNVQASVPFTEPPPGTYYIHLLVIESPNFDLIMDYVTFSFASAEARASRG
jgi:hypothetical protein